MPETDEYQNTYQWQQHLAPGGGELAGCQRLTEGPESLAQPARRLGGFFGRSNRSHGYQTSLQTRLRGLRTFQADLETVDIGVGCSGGEGDTVNQLALLRALKVLGIEVRKILGLQRAVGNQ